jgi:hypothetical protein
MVQVGPGNVGGSPTPGNHTAETALAGWGARIRTWEWRNQNPRVPPLISRIILKNPRNPTPFQSIGWTRIQNANRLCPCLTLGIKLMTFGEHCSDINAINSGTLLAE